MKWEYKVVKKNVVGWLRPHVEEEDIAKLLTDHGNDGWELVSLSGVSIMKGTTDHIVFVFKRAVG